MLLDFLAIIWGILGWWVIPLYLSRHMARNSNGELSVLAATIITLLFGWIGVIFVRLATME